MVDLQDTLLKKNNNKIKILKTVRREINKKWDLDWKKFSTYKKFSKNIKKSKFKLKKLLKDLQLKNKK